MKKLKLEILHYLAKAMGIRFHIDGVGYGKAKNMSEYEDYSG